MMVRNCSSGSGRVVFVEANVTPTKIATTTGFKSVPRKIIWPIFAWAFSPTLISALPSDNRIISSTMSAIERGPAPRAPKNASIIEGPRKPMLPNEAVVACAAATLVFLLTTREMKNTRQKMLSPQNRYPK